MTKRILSIDGGGLRGVFAAAVIEQMEEVNGKPACEIFDCFCGTSAGALLAGGLAAGKTASAMKQLFIDLGETMSKLMSEGSGADGGEQSPEEKAAAARVARQQSGEALDRVLKSVFGTDLRPNQLKRWVAIPARDMALGKVVFFGNFERDQLPNDPSFWNGSPPKEDIPMWEIVRRSAALPPLFSPAGRYLDGGVSPFANPTYAAYVGVQRCLGWKPHEEGLRFYSVGTGYHRTHVQDLDDLDDTKLYGKMVGAMMQDINFLQHQVMKRRQAEGTIWYRRYNVSFDPDGLNWLGLDLSQEVLRELAMTATPLVRELADIGTAVGRRLVKKGDFLDLSPVTDRRCAERRSRSDRRVVSCPVSHDGRSAPTRRRRERRVMKNVRSFPAIPSGRAA